MLGARASSRSVANRCGERKAQTIARTHEHAKAESAADANATSIARADHYGATDGFAETDIDANTAPNADSHASPVTSAHVTADAKTWRCRGGESLE